MMQDFAFDKTNGKFTVEAADNVVGDLVLSMISKCRSDKYNLGRPEYPGDWFFNPSFGNRSYTIKTTTPENLNLLKNVIEIELNRLVELARLKSFVVTQNVDFDNKNRVNININAIQADGLEVTYDYFVEVV